MKSTAATCAVLVLLAACAAPARAEKVGVFTAVKSPLSVRRDGAALSPRVGDEIHLADSVQTGAGGRAKILFDDDVILVVTENTVVEITKHLFDIRKTWRDSIFDLRKGMIRSTLEKYSPDSSFIVRSPNAVAGVKGTDFLVRYAPGTEPLTDVYVFKGAVEVKNPLAASSGAVLIGMNQRLAVRGDSAVPPPAPLPAGERGILDAASSLADQVSAKAGRAFGVSPPAAADRSGPGIRASGGILSPARSDNPQVSVAGMDFIPPKGAGISISGPAVRPPSGEAVNPPKPPAPQLRPAGPPVAGPPVRPPVSR